MKLWRDRRRPSAKVKRLALEHIRELEEKIQEMQTMKSTLEHLAEHCHGDERPDCPILEELAAPPCHAPGQPGKPAKPSGCHFADK